MRTETFIPTEKIKYGSHFTCCNKTGITMSMGCPVPDLFFFCPLQRRKMREKEITRE